MLLARVIYTMKYQQKSHNLHYELLICSEQKSVPGKEILMDNCVYLFRRRGYV